MIANMKIKTNTAFTIASIFASERTYYSYTVYINDDERTYYS